MTSAKYTTLSLEDDEDDEGRVEAIIVASPVVQSENEARRRLENSNNTFYTRYIKRRMNKGFLSNLSTFLLMILGAIIVFAVDKDSKVGQFILAAGLFGFSGGITNWLAIKMLFDRIPGLYGSGIIPAKFREIRETVKNVIMATFFDQEYLEKYLKEKTPGFLASLDLETKLKEMLDSPAVEKLIETKLAEISTRPEGMLFAMMGINPVQLKPIVKPFVVGMSSELVPMLTTDFEPSKYINIGTIRDQVDKLMTTKLEELTPDRVKKLMEDVIRDHLGWLIVWGNVFGALIGIASKIVELVFT